MFFYLTLLTVLITLLIKYAQFHYSYWERRGFPYDKDNHIPFGCLESVMKHKKSMGLAIYDVYVRTKDKFVGIFFLHRPAVLVRDVQLARKVMAQDFASFHDRGVYIDEKKDPISANIFTMRGQDWRNMRQKLAPSFTSGKLKAMFSTSDDVGNKMVDHLNTLLPKGGGSKEIDLKEITATYAIDIIGSVIFGLQINSFENRENVFRKVVERTRRNDLISAILGACVFLCPVFVQWIAKLGLRNEAAHDLLAIMKETIEHRDKHNIVRKDMLQLLMQLYNTGTINEDDNSWGSQYKAGAVKHMSLECLASQAFIFYIAGQETTASTAAFTIFELAQYPDILQKAQKEVKETLEKYNGQITYEALQEMEFLELCMMETMRKYPGLPILNRECTQDYTIPDTDLVIKKGTPIVISLFGIHRDPEHFPDPDRYDPERFDEANRNYNPEAYMPFGEGPRHCIAQRMGKINSKLAVVKILQSFNIEIAERREIEFENYSIALLPKGGVPVRFSRK